MKQVFKYTLIILIFFTFSLSLTNCKKYPENTIWFKRVDKINFFDGQMQLTKFDVNGIDSLLMLNNFFGSKANAKNMKDTYFTYYTCGGSSIKCGGLFEIIIYL